MMMGMKSLLLALPCVLCSLWAGAAALPQGDVNGDGQVTIADANAVIAVILNQDDAIDERALILADVNGDGLVTIADANTVIGYILGGVPEAAPLVGGDISMLTAYEAHQQLAQNRYGVTTAHYYDRFGQRVDDVIAFVKKQGWNAARVRLFVNPENASAEARGQGVIQNLDSVIALGRRIKQAGMAFMLDFHYSDTWADPSSQYTPKEWAALDDSALTRQVYDYTRECLLRLRAAGAVPDLIQTGNEISYGMLWGGVGTPDSQLKKCYTNSSGENWTRFTSLLMAAGRACREVCPHAKIVLHTERVPRVNVLFNFYNVMTARGIDYDVIGLSYYPYYHGKLEVLNSVLTQLTAQGYGKEIMIVETGYSYKYTVGDIDYSATYPLTYEGQRAFTAALVGTLRTHSDVKGIFWWFPEANEYGLGGSYWQQLHVNDNWYNAGLWDHSTGRATPALYELKKLAD